MAVVLNPRVVESYGKLFLMKLQGADLPKYITKEADRQNPAQVILVVREGYEEAVLLWITEHGN